MRQAHLGTDIIEISRIQRAISRWGVHFMGKVYTDKEIKLCCGRVESLAARFAGKEAVMKSLNGSGFGLSWKEIEILADENGRPAITLHGNALKRSRALNLKEMEISLSHSRDLAVAFTLGISGK
jgi:holo-[acyl-carrier protein] synthase